MATGRKRHRTLKVLDKYYKRKSGETSNVTEEGKSLSVEEINNRTGYRFEVLTDILRHLKYLECVAETTLDGHDETLFYRITDRGRIALSSNEFLWYGNQTIIANRALLVAVISGLISLLALFYPVWGPNTNK